MILFTLLAEPSAWAKNRVKMTQANRTLFNTGICDFLGENAYHLTAVDWDNLDKAGKFNKYSGREYTEEQKQRYKEALNQNNISDILARDAEIMEKKRNLKDYKFAKYYQKLTTKPLAPDIEKLILTPHLFKIINPSELQQDDDDKDFLKTIDDLLIDVKQRNKQRLDLYLPDLENNLAKLIRRHWLLLLLQKKEKQQDESITSILEQLSNNINTKIGKVEKILKDHKGRPLPSNIDKDKLQDNPPKNPKKIIICLHKIETGPEFFNNYNGRNIIEELGLRDSEDVLCVAPTAPFPSYRGRQTGWQWFELKTLTATTQKEKDDVQRDTRKKTRPFLKQYIRDLKAQYPNAKIELFGYSQGAIVGLDLITHTQYKDRTKPNYFDVEIDSGVFVAGGFDNRDEDGNIEGKTIHIIHSLAKTNRDGKDVVMGIEYAEEAQRILEGMDPKAREFTLENGAPWHILNKETIYKIMRHLNPTKYKTMYPDLKKRYPDLKPSIEES